MKGGSYYHPHTNKEYNIQGHYTCESRNAIYIVRRPFSVLHVEEMIRHARDHIRTGSYLLPIPNHFHHKGHTIEQLKYQIIEQVELPRRCGNIKKKHFLRREVFWMHTLKTLEWRGLNREYEVAHLIA